MHTLGELESALKNATARYERELSEEKAMTAEFERSAVTVSPARFAELQAQLDQKRLIVASALKDKNEIQTEFDPVRIAEDQRLQREAARVQLATAEAEQKAAADALNAKRGQCFQLQQEIPKETEQLYGLMRKCADLRARIGY
jgi:hypothetical protein